MIAKTQNIDPRIFSLSKHEREDIIFHVVGPTSREEEARAFIHRYDYEFSKEFSEEWTDFILAKKERRLNQYLFSLYVAVCYDVYDTLKGYFKQFPPEDISLQRVTPATDLIGIGKREKEILAISLKPGLKISTTTKYKGVKYRNLFWRQKYSTPGELANLVFESVISNRSLD